MTYDDQTTQRQHLEQSQPLSSHLSYSSHFRSSAGVHTKLRSSASGRSHQCARRLRVASALATHGALYLADHCTQGQQPRRSCAPLRVGIFARVRSHRDTRGRAPRGRAWPWVRVRARPRVRNSQERLGHPPNRAGRRAEPPVQPGWPEGWPEGWPPAATTLWNARAARIRVPRGLFCPFFLLFFSSDCSGRDQLLARCISLPRKLFVLFF